MLLVILMDLHSSSDYCWATTAHIHPKCVRSELYLTYSVLMPPAHHLGNLYSIPIKTVLCLPCSLHEVSSATQGMLERYCQRLCEYKAQEGWGFLL